MKIQNKNKTVNLRPSNSLRFVFLVLFIPLFFSIRPVSSEDLSPQREMLIFEKMKKSVRVLVLLSRDIHPYTEALEGFKFELESRGMAAQCNVYNLEGSFEEGYKIIEAYNFKDADFVLSVGSIATKIAYNEISEIPIIFTMVLNPISCGFIEDFENPGENITGSSLDIPFDVQLNELKLILPRVNKVGILYNPEETEKVVEEIRIIAPDFNLEIITKEVYSQKMVPGALDNLIKKVDAIFSIGCSTVFTPQSEEFIIFKCIEEKIPFVGLSESFVKKGALYAVSADYRDVGKQAGEIATKIIEGEEVKNIPVTRPKVINLSINLKTADKLGIKIKKDIIERAKEVVR